MGIAMKTHLFLTGAVVLFGTLVFSTSFAYDSSEYLHFTRHRDSNGNLLAGPTRHQSKDSVMQKTVMPAQPKTIERQSTDWGMHAQEVKDIEPVKPSWELGTPILEDYEQRVAYHTQIEGIDTSLTYTFYEDHLGQAKYVFEPQHEDALDYVADFHTVKNWIGQTYGWPTSVQEIWLDDLYQYDQSLWGQAVLRGHLVMVAEWKQSGTEIVLVLDGGNDTIGLVADFGSTTVVVPVSIKTEVMEESVMEDTSVMEAIPIEDLQGQTNPMEESSMGDTSTETDVTAQTLLEIDQELEKLMKEYPASEQTLEELLTEENPSEAALEPHDSVPAMDHMEGSLGQDPMEEHSMSEHSLIEPSIGENPTEATLESQDPVDAPMEMEGALGEAPMGEPSMSEHSMMEPAVGDQPMEGTGIPAGSASAPESDMGLDEVWKPAPMDEPSMSEHTMMEPAVGDQPMEGTGIPAGSASAPESDMGLDEVWRPAPMDEPSRGEHSMIEPSVGEQWTETTLQPQGSLGAVEMEADPLEEPVMKEHVIKSETMVEPSTESDKEAQKL